MAETTKTAKRITSDRSKAMEWVCDHIIPNCDKAISLVEKGIEEPLSGGDKLSLKYHGHLCPFCGCNEGKFSSLLERYKSIESERHDPKA